MRHAVRVSAAFEVQSARATRDSRRECESEDERCNEQDDGERLQGRPRNERRELRRRRVFGLEQLLVSSMLD